MCFTDFIFIFSRGWLHQHQSGINMQTEFLINNQKRRLLTKIKSVQTLEIQVWARNFTDSNNLVRKSKFTRLAIISMQVTQKPELCPEHELKLPIQAQLYFQQPNYYLTKHQRYMQMSATKSKAPLLLPYFLAIYFFSSKTLLVNLTLFMEDNNRVFSMFSGTEKRL